MRNFLADKTPRERFSVALSTIGAVVGLKYGFEFGYRIGGMLMAVFVAAICGVFGALFVGGIADRLLRRDETGRNPP